MRRTPSVPSLNSAIIPHLLALTTGPSPAGTVGCSSRFPPTKRERGLTAMSRAGLRALFVGVLGVLTLGALTVPPASASTGTTVGVGSGRCLDDTGNTANGTQQYIWDCTGGNANQQYTYTSASELRIAGKCLDANGQGTSNGTKVILWTCTGANNQKW